MMRAALGVLLLLGGCGAPPALVALPVPSLGPGLLTEADLPGFTRFDFFDPGGNEIVGCAPMSLSETPDVTTQFRASEQGPYVQSSLSLRSDADAKAAMESARAVLRDCPSFSTRTLDGQTMSTTVSPGVVTGLGDETVAVRFSTTVAGQPPFLSDQVIVRSGRLLIAVAHNNYHTVNPSLTETAIHRAVQRAGALK